MVVSVSASARKNLEGLLQKLAPLGEIDGVRDYFLVDRQGTLLARKPGSAWQEELASACARDIALVGEILSLLSAQDRYPQAVASASVPMHAPACVGVLDCGYLPSQKATNGNSGDQGTEPDAGFSDRAARERVFYFHFKGTLLIGWHLDGAYLLALCREDANLAIVRMTVNVVKEELGKDKWFRSYLSKGAEPSRSLLSEQNLGSELYRHVEALRQE